MNIYTRFLIFSFFIFLQQVAFSQFILPKFEKPEQLFFLNSVVEESMPLPTENGEKLYFVRTDNYKMKGRSVGQEICFSNRIDDGWLSPEVALSDVNDNGNNAVIGTSADGNRVYLFNSIQSRRSFARGIAYTEKDKKGKWSNLKKLDIPGFEVGQGFYSFYINPMETIIMLSMPPTDTSLYEDLFVSLKDKNGNWGRVINLGSAINTPNYEITPYISDDEKTLYFSSNGHNGLGDADIFVSYRLDDSWTNWTIPLNLEAPINSKGFDAYFILGNNREVYFISNRGQELSDIYYTKQKMGIKYANKNTEVSIQAKFISNTIPQRNVSFLVYNEDNDLIDSLVTDSLGMITYKKQNISDNYTFKLLPKDTAKYVHAKLYLTNDKQALIRRFSTIQTGVYYEGDSLILTNDELYGQFKFKKLPMAENALIILDENGFPIDTIYTDKEGMFVYRKLIGDKVYNIVPIDISDEDMVYVEITLIDDNFILAENTKMEVTSEPTIIKENRIYFSYNEYELTQDDLTTLNEIARQLKMTNQKIIVEGHTDNRGSDAANERISQFRAKNAQQYLIARGISPSRIKVIAYSKDKPMATNETDAGRAKNRRVEVLF